MMQEKNEMKEILDGIKEAIADEIRAQRNYQCLANKAKDPGVKKFFEQLKLEEQEHERVLRARYEAFSKLL